MTEPIIISSDLEAREHCKDPEFRALLRRELWYQGNFEHALRPHGQAQVHKFIEDTQKKAPGPRPFCAETHRRWGKSHYFLARGVGRCLRLPGQRFIYALPTKEDAKDIVIPNLSRVIEGCPAELRPKKSGLTWTFQNPRWKDKEAVSTIAVAGINSDKDAGRGGGCDEVVVDEAGYVLNLEYWLREVAGPQFVGRYNATCSLISSTPKTMSHPYIQKYIPEAKAFNRYIRIRGSDNPDFTPADRDILHQIVGPEDSIAWRREIECEHITDEEDMIVPEFTCSKAEIVKKIRRPDFFYPDICADVGYADYTHILFGYVHFTEQKLIIEDEIWVHYRTLGELADLIHRAENELYNPKDIGEEPYKRLRRVADATPIDLETLARDHGLPFGAAAKHNADATIAQLRTAIQERTIMIHPRCKQLLYQLENGIWNERRTDFVRNETLGHCDGIKALSYMIRMARWRINPKPAEMSHTRQTVSSSKFKYIPPSSGRSDNPIVRALRRG